MKIVKISLLSFTSVGLIFLSACSGGNQAANSENSTKTATTETSAKTGEVHNENDGHDHEKKSANSNGEDKHSGQVIESGKYHLEFKQHTEKDSTHLDITLHDEQDKAVTDAKLTAQVQLPDGTNKTLQVPYNTEEKQYTAKLPATATGEYKVVIQTDVKGEKFNSRFTFKR
ncbi:MAG: FixH family protein [Aulosira sp. ZfuCHP01]|nr:FixH family protein [Aulosira sp. ZfuVER01]MDZ8000914.1 FixH family protein [Aulosira sp. DedVER01a]MDZ8052400.1 FixH family protein [Aulosira sp. ZfuCHP01]